MGKIPEAVAGEVIELVTAALQQGHLAALRTLAALPRHSKAEALTAACSRQFGLTHTESLALIKLLQFEHVTKRDLHSTMAPTSGINGVNVLVCKLRRKLGHFGIRIVTLHGQGYRIEKTDRDSIRKLIAESEGDTVAAATPVSQGGDHV